MRYNPKRDEELEEPRPFHMKFSRRKLAGNHILPFHLAIG